MFGVDRNSIQYSGTSLAKLVKFADYLLIIFVAHNLSNFDLRQWSKQYPILMLLDLEHGTFTYIHLFSKRCGDGHLSVAFDSYCVQLLSGMTTIWY